MNAFQNVYNSLYWHIEHEDYSLLFFIKLIGLFYVVKFLWWYLSGNLQSLVCKLISFVYKPNLKKYGRWAVVTGSTDGIGKAYAIELAKRKMDLVLISRTLQKLNDTANEIRKQYDVEVKIIQADFSEGLQVYAHIEKELQDMDVGILVNNVGIAPPHPTFRKFDDISKEHLYNEITVNTGAPSQMTRMLLPHMKQRKRGMIVFVGSIVQVFKSPYFVNYSGTKAFVGHFVNCLTREISHHNIQTQILIPSVVDTNMSKGDHFMRKMHDWLRAFAYPTATTYASWAICTLGWCKFATGYWFFDCTKVFSIMGENLGIMPFVLRQILRFSYGSKVIN